MEVRPARPARRDARCGVRARHAGAARAHERGVRRGIRPLPHRVDRVLGGGSLSAHRRNGAVRDHQGFGRPAHAGPATAGAADRLCVRRLHRGRGRIRHARGRRRGHAHGARLHSFLCRGDLPRRQYGAGGVRRHRHAARHAGGRDGPAVARAERGSRPHLRASVVVHSGVSDDGDGRAEAPARRVAGCARRAVVCFALTQFLVSTLHRPVSHGHSRFARHDARAGGAAAAVAAA